MQLQYILYVCSVNLAVNMSGKKQWTVEECSNLIEVYREHPNLWNASHIEYKNRIKKYDSLKEIAELFGTKYEEVERKIKNITTQYQRERRNYKRLKHSGAGHIFKAKWFGYAAMCFLHDKNKPIKESQVGLDFEDSDPSSSEDSDAKESQTCELSRDVNESQICELRCNANESHTCELEGNVVQLENHDVQLENQERMAEPLEQNIEQGSELLKSQKPEQINITPSTSQVNAKKRPAKQHLFSAPKTVKKRSKLIESGNTSNVAKEAFDMMKSVYQKTQGPETRDKYSIFGELVGHTIRNLKTDFSKATVEHLINNILYQAQVGKYDFPQYSSVPSYSYTTSSSTYSAPSPHPTETNTDNQTTVTSDVLGWALTNKFGIDKVTE